MKAWVIDGISDLNEMEHPLKRVEVPKPVPENGELLIRVKACGVCHTEIDEIEGRTSPPVLPVIPGHQVVGIIEETKGSNPRLVVGKRIGVAWIYSSCGVCEFCATGRENLCADFQATGRDAHGGYAEYMVVPERFVYSIPGRFSDVEAAPLLCAGAIGYRSLILCNIHDGQDIGLTGFGASAHIVLKLIKYKYPHSGIYVFARNPGERKFALQLGASWAGDTSSQPPVLLDAVIDTTPVWKPAIAALEFLKPGGRLVINAIRKESIDQEQLLQLDYSRHLWMEKEIKSVANITGGDVRELLRIAEEVPLKPDVEVYPFENANQAIMDIKHRKIKGAKVLVL